MTPKEYAEELINEFTTIEDGEMYIGKAKQCALVSIDSIIRSTRMLVNHYVENNGVKAYIDIMLSKDLTLKYFIEVKQEIEKL